MKKIKTPLMPLLALIIISCAVQKDKILNLDSVNLDFNVGDFYADKIANTNKTISQDPKKMDKKEVKKLLNENFFVKDTLLNFSDAAQGDYIDKKNYKDKRENLGIFGYDYSTMSWNQQDSLAVLNGVYFQRINMLETKKGRFLALNAITASNNDKNYLSLNSYLKKKYGAPKNADENKRANREVLNWETEKELILLITKRDTVQNVLSISITGEKEIELLPSYEIAYLKINKAEIERLKKLHVGSWLPEEMK